MSCGGQRPAAEVVQEVSITTLFFSHPIISKNVASRGSSPCVLMTRTTRGYQDSKIIGDMWLFANYPADQLGSLSVTEQEEQEQENTHSFSNWVLALNSLDVVHFCKSLYGQITKTPKKTHSPDQFDLFYSDAALCLPSIVPPWDCKVGFVSICLEFTRLLSLWLFWGVGRKA